MKKRKIDQINCKVVNTQPLNLTAQCAYKTSDIVISMGVREKAIRI